MLYLSNVGACCIMLRFLQYKARNSTQISIYVNKICGTTSTVKFSTWWDGRIIWGNNYTPYGFGGMIGSPIWSGTPKTGNGEE